MSLRITNSQLGYTLNPLITANFSPADATTYYVGAMPNAAAANRTDWATMRLYVPKAGTIRTVHFHIVQSTTASSELVTLALRLNDSTDTTLTTTSNWSTAAAIDMTFTGLSIALAAGDYIALKIITPTWATTNSVLTGAAIIYIE